MFYTVYKITNKINQKIYVGVHKTDDPEDDYMGSGELIKKAIKKHGLDNFMKEYISIFDNPEDMFNMESNIVNEHFVHDCNTYNMIDGGLGGDTSQFISYDSEEYKKNVSDAMIKMYTENPERLEKVVAHLGIHRGSFTGKHHTSESKQKISEANSNQRTGKENPQYGTCWIHSLTAKVSKKIKKAELPSFLSKGWIKGRKIKF